MNRNTSFALLLALATLASVKALDLKRHIRQPLTARKFATLTPLREEQILTTGAAALKDAFAAARADDWLRRVDARARPRLRAARRRRRRGLGADPSTERGPLAVRAPHHCA